MSYPNEPGFHKGSPDTSEGAAEVMLGKAEALRNRVYQKLKTGWRGTADQMAWILDESPLAVRPRFSELRAKGLICDTGERRRNASGRLAAVWAVVTWKTR